MSVAIVNIGRSHRGVVDPHEPGLAGDALVCEDGVVSWIGPSGDVVAEDHEEVLDAGGAGVIPGLIDSHVHVTFGDYTPRHQVVGFLESYLHGGMTRAISASEVHVPGRPTDPAGVKALAIAAQGVWLAKAGFGAVETPMDYVPLVRAARAAGLVVMCHTGGGSIPGSLDRIDAEALLAMQPNISGHVNGGPTAMSPRDNERIVRDGGDIALQLATAGNLRSALQLCSLARDHDQVHRLLVSSDTPTGTGTMPLAMVHLMAELVSLGGLTADLAVAAASGNVGRAYRLDAGILEVGRPADLLVVDAPLGSMGDDWAGALEAGDVPAIGAAVTSGQVRFTRSRNTPAPKRPITQLSRITRRHQ